MSVWSTCVCTIHVPKIFWRLWFFKQKNFLSFFKLVKIRLFQHISLTFVGAQSRRAAQNRRIGENRRAAQSRRVDPMSPCHVIAKLSYRKRIVVHI